MSTAPRARRPGRRRPRTVLRSLPFPRPAQPPRARRCHAGRRARGPVALLAAVAIAAAVIGGGTATLVGRYADNASTGGGTTVSGTTVSQSSKGTVSGVAQAVSPAIVEINATSTGGQATGSGVVITSDGEIVTNNHVVSGASTVKVQLSDGKSYTANVVGTAPDKDLALIKLQGASGLKTASLGDSSQVKVGDEVVAIGSPEGLTGTVTSGIISALNRDVTVAKDEDQGSSSNSNSRVGATGRSSSAGSSSTGAPGPRRPRTRRSRPTPRSTRATRVVP